MPFEFLIFPALLGLIFGIVNGYRQQKTNKV